MSQDVASKQPLISTALEVKPAAEDQNQQRKCGVHRLQPQEKDKGVKPEKKRSVDAVVEAYLDEHPAFLDDYVKRKVSRRQLEQWLFLPFINSTNSTSKVPPEESSLKKQYQPRKIQSCDSSLNKTGGLLSSACVRRAGQPETAGSGSGHEQQRQRSHSFTPALRKLSATTFEAGGLATPILATTSDGQPSFLRTASVTSVSGKSYSPIQRRIDNNAAITNRKDILFTLLPDILSQRSDISTFAKILMKSANLLMGQAAKVDLLLLQTPNSFNGTAFMMKSEVVIQCPDAAVYNRSNPLLKSVLTTPLVLNISEGLDIVLDDGVQNSDLRISNALLGPLYSPEANATIGCLQLYNKVGGFSADDEALFGHLLSVASIGLSNLLLQQEMRLELARSEVFLELARTVFREPSRLEATMLIILTNFLSLIDCQRCQISLCDRERPSVFKRVFDLQRHDLGKELETPYENRLPLKGEITENVAITGQKINLVKDQLLQDDECHSFLALAIRDPDGIVGVISLANKETVTSENSSTLSDDSVTATDNNIFTDNDERFVEAFAVFCGMAIRNAADYERAVLSEAKLQVAFEVMNFQATSNADNASYLASLPVSAASSTHVDSFHFNYLKMDDDATLTATIRIFTDLGLLKQFGIEYSTLCRWLLTVKRNYRNETVQYHNWFHAFNVTQMMFCMLLKTRLNRKFSSIDILGLIVACISHDLDHRGTNNSFQHKMNNPLAKLYSTSTLERHHLNQCLLILTLRGNQILDNLTKDEYAEALAVIERSILATDLALHFRDAQALSKLATSISQCPKKLDALITEENLQSKHLMQAGMMTAADLGNATKPWDVHYHVSQLIAEEFWTQGDIERKEFNLEPQPMFDRSVSLRDSQLDFLDNTCLPLYEDMSRFSAELHPLMEGCRDNRQRWANNHSNEVSKSTQSESTEVVEQARNL